MLASSGTAGRLDSHPTTTEAPPDRLSHTLYHITESQKLKDTSGDPIA